MTRAMVNDDGTVEVEVVMHIILRNFWEYYIIEPDESRLISTGRVTALVVGDFTEIGDVYLPEITPYIVSRTRDLSEVLPAPQWRWGDSKTFAAEMSQEESEV
tara:strand:- start:76 stop:384 length:309 start_codon:yes stop_codon:yes gene_type:complete